MARVPVSEIIRKCSEFKSKEQRVEALRYNAAKIPLIKTLLQYMFDPRIQWLLPTGEVPYQPSKFDEDRLRFYAEARKLYLFVKGGNPNLKQMRREMLFIEFIQAIDPEDAKFVSQ